MSSIPPNSHWRGCAANFAQPVSENDERAAQFLVETVYYFNCYLKDAPMTDIVYRSSDGEEDITRHVFRWDLSPYQEIFQNGFQARRQQGTPDEVYYDLKHYVHHGGRPLNSTRPATHVFISATLNRGWHPSLESETEIEVYRYEIYAPGGIWVAETLGDQYQYPAEDEVVFVAGIAPQYVRSAQLFKLVAGSRYTTRTRVDETIIINGNFHPQSHPPRLLNIQRPVFDCVREDAMRVPLNVRIYRPQAQASNGSFLKMVRRFLRRWYGREKRQILNDAIDWYIGDVANVENYINAAFRAKASNEAYLFMKNEYVLLNYAPATTNDKVLNGPLLICDAYHSLIGTAFGEYGIDCAFDTDYKNVTQAFIFSGNLCALIDYAPYSTNDKILKGPMKITAMFPFFKRTVFQSGIDAAFKEKASNEAYLFKGDQYALINFGDSNHSAYLIAIRKITEGFHSLRNTIFETGIDAAFASHYDEQAYIFKGDQYARINYAQGTTDDYIIGGVKPILPSWPSLRNILPRKNRGLDVHYHAPRDQDHDEH